MWYKGIVGNQLNNMQKLVVPDLMTNQTQMLDGWKNALHCVKTHCATLTSLFLSDRPLHMRNNIQWFHCVH